MRLRYETCTRNPSLLYIIRYWVLIILEKSWQKKLKSFLRILRTLGH